MQLFFYIGFIPLTFIIIKPTTNLHPGEPQSLYCLIPCIVFVNTMTVGVMNNETVLATIDLLLGLIETSF